MPLDGSYAPACSRVLTRTSQLPIVWLPWDAPRRCRSRRPKCEGLGEDPRLAQVPLASGPVLRMDLFYMKSFGGRNNVRELFNSFVLNNLHGSLQLDP